MKQMKDEKNAYFSSAISSELQKPQTEIHPSALQRSLARTVIMGELLLKSQSSKMETSLSISTMPKNIGTGVQKMSQKT